MLYIQPKLDQDPNDESAALLRIIAYSINSSAFSEPPPKLEQWNGAPIILTTAEYILYGALGVTFTGGMYALLIRLTSALGDWRLFRLFFYKFSPFVIWMSIFLMCCSFALIFLAATLQLPAVVDSYPNGFRG